MKLQLYNVLFRFRTLPSLDKAFRSLHYSVPLFASRTDRRSRWKGFPIHVGVGIKKTIEMQSDTDVQFTLTHKPRLSECNSLPVLQESNVQCAACQSRLKAVTGQSPKSPGSSVALYRAYQKTPEAETDIDSYSSDGARANERVWINSTSN